MKLFTIHHGSSSLEGLQGVGGALQNAADAAARVKDQAIRAKYAEAKLQEQQNQLNKEVTQTLKTDEELRNQQAERLATADLAGRILRGEDLSQVPQDQMDRALGAMNPNNVISMMQTVEKQRSAAAAARKKLIDAGRKTALFEAAKKGYVNEEELAVAAAIAEDTGDDSMLKELEAQSNARQERMSQITRSRNTITAFKNSPTFMGELDSRQRKAMERAEDLLSTIENGNVFDDDRFAEAERLLQEARTPTAVLDEMDRLKRENENQQWLVNRYKEMQMGIPQVTDSLGRPIGAPQDLLKQYDAGQASYGAPELGGSGGVPQSGFVGKTPRHYSQLPEDRQREVANGMRQFALDVLDEAGVSASEIDPEVMTATLSSLARDVYNVNIPPGELMDFAARANGGKGGAEAYGQSPLQYSTEPEAAAMREMRKVVREEGGNPLEAARKLKISLKDLQAVANNPEDPPEKWNFDPLPGEEQRAKDDAQKPIPPHLPALMEITQGGFNPNLTTPGFSRDFSSGVNNGEALKADIKAMFSKPGRRPGDPRRKKGE